MTGDHISLFTGVGMLDIAAEDAGFQTVVTAEMNPFCRRLLETRFPSAAHFADVTHITPHDCRFRVTPGKPLLMTGGFPCTDLSGLGARVGLSGARSGLWFEFLRCITEFQPDYVLIENVTVLRSRGMDEVLRGLWGQGYHVRWECIPAALVDAPHLRDRVWIMARKAPFTVPSTAVEIGDFSALCVPSKLPRSGVTCYQSIYATTPVATVKTARLNATAVHGVLLPTPRSAPNEWRTTRNAPSHGNGHGKTLAGELNDRWDTRTHGLRPLSSESAGNVDPTYVEWMMGLPIGWTNPAVPNAQLLPAPGWRNLRIGLQTLVTGAPHRRNRLVALGNGLVPAVASLALDLLINS